MTVMEEVNFIVLIAINAGSSDRFPGRKRIGGFLNTPQPQLLVGFKPSTL